MYHYLTIIINSNQLTNADGFFFLRLVKGLFFLMSNGGDTLQANATLRSSNELCDAAAVSIIKRRPKQ